MTNNVPPERINFPLDTCIESLNAMCDRYKEYGGKTVEYILKSTADKHADEEYSKGYSYGTENEKAFRLQVFNKKIEEILKPAMAFRVKYGKGIVVDDYHKAVKKFDDALQAINDTLERADK
jgi:hypothetical protein